MSNLKEQLEECLGGRDSLHMLFEEAQRMLHGSEGLLTEMPGALCVDTNVHGDGQFFFDETHTCAILRLTLIKVGAFSIHWLCFA